MRIKNAHIRNLTVKSQYIVSGSIFNISSLTSWADANFNGTYSDEGEHIHFSNSGYIQTSNIDINTLTDNDYTYEFWVRTTGSDTGTLLSKFGTGGYHTSAIEISSSTLVVGYWTGSSTSYFGTPVNITRDAWQHYTITYNTTDGTLKTYFNGNLVLNSTFAPEVSPRDYGNNPMFFELFNSESTNFGHGTSLTGDLGEFRLYTRALTAAEVRRNFLATKSRWAPTGLTNTDPGTSAYQIKQDHPESTDGLYWIRNDNINGGNPVQIYADMTTDGGGWTLLLQNTVPSWNFNNALERNSTTPPSTLETAYSGNDSANYSIIGWANYIKRSASGFEYMLEAGARGANGGIWTANEAYSFVEQTNAGATNFGSDVVAGSDGFRQNVTLTTKFGTWEYNSNGLEKRMPWYCNDPTNPGNSNVPDAIFTTSHNDGGSAWWGTLMALGASWQPAPWMASPYQLQNPGIIWYWVR